MRYIQNMESFFSVSFDAKEALVALRKADPILGKWMKKAGPFSLQTRPMHSIFQALGESILYQQISGKAAQSILTKFQNMFGEGMFPNPQNLLPCSPEDLRPAGISKTKALALLDLAHKTVHKHIPSLEEANHLPEEALVQSLTKVRGIGRWTVDMFLLFRLGRTDVLPVTDYAIRKGFAKAFGHKDLPSPAVLTQHAEVWRPYRSLASWYLWRILELPETQKK